MQQAAVIQESNNRQQSGAGEHADNLLLGNAVACEQKREHETQENRDPAGERNRIQVHLPRSRLIDHAEAQREMANGHSEAQRRRQRNYKHDCFGTNRHFYAVSTSESNTGIPGSIAQSGPSADSWFYARGYEPELHFLPQQRSGSTRQL